MSDTKRATCDSRDLERLVYDLCKEANLVVLPFAVLPVEAINKKFAAYQQLLADCKIVDRETLAILLACKCMVLSKFLKEGSAVQLEYQNKAIQYATTVMNIKLGELAASCCKYFMQREFEPLFGLCVPGWLEKQHPEDNVEIITEIISRLHSGVTDIPKKIAEIETFSSSVAAQSSSNSGSQFSLGISSNEIDLELRVVAIQKQLKDTEQQADEAKRRLECISCRAKEKKIRFAPCGHVCNCEACANKVTICPLCRVAIQQREIVYF